MREKVRPPVRQRNVDALVKVHVDDGRADGKPKPDAIAHRLEVRPAYERVKVAYVQVLIQMDGEVYAVFALEGIEAAGAHMPKAALRKVQVEFHKR